MNAQVDGEQILDTVYTSDIGNDYFELLPEYELWAKEGLHYNPAAAELIGERVYDVVRPFYP